MSKADENAAKRTTPDKSVACYPINANGANHTLTPVDDDPKNPVPAGTLHTISPTQALKPMREDRIAQGGQ